MKTPIEQLAEGLARIAGILRHELSTQGRDVAPLIAARPLERELRELATVARLAADAGAGQVPDDGPSDAAYRQAAERMFHRGPDCEVPETGPIERCELPDPGAWVTVRVFVPVDLAAEHAPAPDPVEILRRLEWSATGDREHGGTGPNCPDCGAEEGGDHFAACELARIIRGGGRS